MKDEIDTESFNDKLIRGTKEAIDLEVQRLRDEGWPILIWRDGKVVDIREELDLQNSVPCNDLSLRDKEWAMSFWYDSQQLHTPN